MDFSPHLSTWLPSEHLACGCWNSPRPSRPSPSPAGPQGNTRRSPPSCVTTIEEHPSWTLRLPRRAVCLPPDLDSVFPPLPVGPLEPPSGWPLLKIRSRRFALLPYSRNRPSHEVRRPRRGPATTMCCRSASALGVSHPLDGLGSAPLGECCTPAGQDSHRFQFGIRLSPYPRHRLPRLALL
jgi:hypothetical protein